MASKLEPEYHDVFHAYQQDQSPKNAGELLRAVQPILESGARVYGGQSSPLIRSRARKVALDSFDRYDHARASLRTHLMQQLQSLQRYSASLDHHLSVPEQVLLDRNRLQQSTSELQDRQGREVSDGELADHAGLSLKRIQYIRKYKPAVTEGQVASRFQGEGDEQDFEPEVKQEDPTHRIASWLYHDQHPIDQLILEHRIGFNGAEILPHNEIARRAGVSPAAISQRAQKLQAKMDELQDSGLF